MREPSRLQRSATALHAARNAAGLCLSNHTRIEMMWAVLYPADYYDRIKSVHVTPKLSVAGALRAAGIIGVPTEDQLLDAIESAIAIYESEIADGK